MTRALYYPVPDRAVFRPCRTCLEPIAFVPTDAGRLMPVDRDGRSHFQTCTNPELFSKGAR